METKVTSPGLKGTLIALVLIIFGLIIYFTGQTQNKTFSSLSFFIFNMTIIGSCILHAKQMDKNVTFGNVFADGFKTASAATAIFIIYTFIAFKFIMPDLVDLSLEEVRKGMEANKNLTPEQIEKSLTMVKKFFIPFAIAGALFMYLLVGLAGALIGAAIAKKNPVVSPFDQ